HRVRRGPLRRCRDGASSAQPFQAGHPHHPRIHARDGQGVEGGRADERAVRRERRNGLRPGSQPAGLAHGAIRVKAIRAPLAKLAARIMAGKTLRELGFTEEIWPAYWAVKESVFPFNRFHGQDILLSPERRSTGEVMGLDADLGIAYAKSQMAALAPLPLAGKVFISVSNAHKKEAAAVARDFAQLGFELVATAGTASVLEAAGLKVQRIYK